MPHIRYPTKYPNGQQQDRLTDEKSTVENTRKKNKEARMKHDSSGLHLDLATKIGISYRK